MHPASCPGGEFISVAIIELVHAIVPETEIHPISERQAVNQDAEGIAQDFDHDRLRPGEADAKTTVGIDDGAAALQRACNDFHTEGADGAPGVIVPARITTRLCGVENFKPPPASGATPSEKPSLCQRDLSAAIVPQMYW